VFLPSAPQTSAEWILALLVSIVVGLVSVAVIRVVVRMVNWVVEGFAVAPGHDAVIPVTQPKAEPEPAKGSKTRLSAGRPRISTLIGVLVGLTSFRVLPAGP
jgi:hypothetical protein